ncbi:MAG: hypothetical protein ACXW39_00255 [Nitrospira sp.]
MQKSKLAEFGTELFAAKGNNSIAAVFRHTFIAQDFENSSVRIFFARLQAANSL